MPHGGSKPNKPYRIHLASAVTVSKVRQTILIEVEVDGHRLDFMCDLRNARILLEATDFLIAKK